MWERIRQMLVKEFIQAFRDPRMKAVAFVAPVVQLVIFGYVVTTDVRHVATALYDLDNTVMSRELTGRFTRSGYFDVAEYVSDDRRARELLDRGDVRMVLRIDKGFEKGLLAGRSAPVQVLLDGTDSNTAGIVLNYTAKITNEFSQEALESRATRLLGAARAPGRVELVTRAWFNENLESRNFYVPGVIATLLMLMTLLMTSMAIVREKEIGTIEQIMVTPITPLEFILGKTLPFVLVGLADVVLITLIGVFWFNVPIRGSLLVLFAGALLFIFTSLGVGLLISSISQTQQQAMMTTFFFYMPAMLLSGFMFPIANMPVVIQWLTYLNPLRYFLVIIRGLFLKGVGVSILWPQMLALAVMGVATLWLASRRFTKTLA